MRANLIGAALVVDFGGERRVLSSAVLGGGLLAARSWLNVTVPSDYSRTDPAADLAGRARSIGLPRPVIGMLTAVDIRSHVHAGHGAAHAFVTVGVGHALAAAGIRPRAVPGRGGAGTINMLVLVDETLDDAALAGAAQTAVEAKAQALADAGVRARNAAGFATGTATDAFCIAALPGGGVPFAGPATRVGADIARAVFAAVRAGAMADQAARLTRSAGDARPGGANRSSARTGSAER